MFRNIDEVMTLLAVIPMVMCLAAPLDAWAEEATSDRHFHGPYVGAEFGFQSIVAGADANGTDVLAQETRAAGTAIGGFRLQFGDGFVVGVEGSLGVFDGELELQIPAANAQFIYDGGTQWGIGGTLGHTIGEDTRTLLFAYASEMTRVFDVTINAPGGPFRQQDVQGILRFGLGVERQVREGLHLRATVGSAHAEFDGPTFNDFETPFEVAIAAIFQF